MSLCRNLRQRLTPILSSGKINKRMYAVKKKCYPLITMDDLPCPEGDWYEMNDKQQRKYNVHLVLGIGSLLATIVFGYATQMFAAYNDIPDEPADIQCYRG